MTDLKHTAPVEEVDAAFERRMAAVSAAVDNYHRYLLDYLHRLTRQWQDAENLAQDLWRHVLLNFDEDKIGCLPLLRRKAYQMFIDHYRRQIRRGEILPEEMPEVPAQHHDFSAFTEDEESALQEKFWSEYPGIELSITQKQALWLHARYGFTHKEIAQKLEVPSSTIGDWIILARKKLTEILNSQLQ